MQLFSDQPLHADNVKEEAKKVKKKKEQNKNMIDHSFVYSLILPSSSFCSFMDLPL